MLPVIFLLGRSASGKGTIGGRLAANFDLAHISIGDTFRALRDEVSRPIFGLPGFINEYILFGLRIPDIRLAHFKPVPAILLVHNFMVTGEGAVDAMAAMLREKLAEMAASNSPPRAAIIDGTESAFRDEEDNAAEVYQKFAPTFSGLTILVDCPREVSEVRYLARARPGDDSKIQFNARMKAWEELGLMVLDFLKTQGPVVTCSNDGSKTVDEAYTDLVSDLQAEPIWQNIMQG
ncbi:P-loop containing nucleoside triphosphate hydrolase protein [Xylariaceae sp. FL0255]|nr:P-loop containing nucleoside triphosphate hydrolase protein [Xylariaceae sp. FL0255]